MKKQILICLILINSALSIKAQIYGTIVGSSNNSGIGIGTNNPNSIFNVLVSDQPNIDIATFGLAYNPNHSYWDKAVTIGLRDFHGFISLKNYDLGEKIVLNANGYSYFNGGNVGVGMVSPSSKLFVNGDIAGDGISITHANSLARNWKLQSGIAGLTHEAFAISNNGQIQFALNGQNGDVGIGLNAPGNKLSIWAKDAGDGIFLTHGNYTAGAKDWRLTSGILGVSHQHFAISSGNSVRFSIDGNYGWVGIGIAQPTNKLSIMANDAGDGIFLTHGNYTAGAKDWRITSGIVGYSHEHFAISSGSDVRFTINGNNGYIGVGTKCPKYNLDVIGTIRADEVKVDLTRGCDFVFKNDYKLMDLKELEHFVNTNQHLPEIASEKEMVENGVNMKELQMKLLQKMEEMTLYMIAQNKEIESLKNEITELKKK